MGQVLMSMAQQLRQANQPPGAQLPDVPWQNAPPGRTAEDMTAEQQQLLLVAAEGLAAHLRGQLQVARMGSPASREIARALGAITTAANQLRRWVEARDSDSQVSHAAR